MDINGAFRLFIYASHLQVFQGICLQLKVVGKSEGKRPFECLGIGESIILVWVLGK
jgi:hypothetical protein